MRAHAATERDGTLAEPAPADHDAQLAESARGIEQPGQYLCY